MGRDFAKARRRSQANRARAAAIEDGAALARLSAADDDRGPTKAELREQAAAALAAYGGPVTRLPTTLFVRCLCGHTARVSWPAGAARPALRCSRCRRLA